MEQESFESPVKVNLLWDHILMVSVHGVVDSQFAQDLMEGMLVKIKETGARVIILDIIGVAAVDSAVANHLIKIKNATQLMGCKCIISGMSPGVAQSIVNLGIDLGSIYTRATLRDALELAFDSVGLRVVPEDKNRD